MSMNLQSKRAELPEPEMNLDAKCLPAEVNDSENKTDFQSDVTTKKEEGVQADEAHEIMLDEIKATEEVVKEAPLETENQIEKPAEAAPEITAPVVEEVVVELETVAEIVPVEAVVSAEHVPEKTAADIEIVEKIADVEPIADMLDKINTEIKAVDEILSKKRSFEKIASTTEAVDMRKESESKRLKIDQPVSH